MIDTKLPSRPTSQALRTLGWVGLWIGSICLLPALALWTHSFNPQRPLRLPHPGTSLFWIMAGLDALMASLLTFGQWQDQKKPKKRKPHTTPPTPKDRWQPVWAGGLLLGFLVLRILAANPGAAINWGGVLGGAAALALLFTLMMWCAKLTQPLRVCEDAASDTLPSLTPTAPLLPLGIRPPKNSYRAEVSGREAVYSQPLGGRIFYGVFGVILGAAAIVSEGFSLLGLGISLWGIHPHHHNPAMALLMGGGGIFGGCIALSALLMTGPRELRVSPSDSSYTYRLCTPVRWPFLIAVTDDNTRSMLGLPWKVIEYQGRLSDITGVQRRQSTNKSTTTYWLFLCWQDSSRPPMQVGFSTDEGKARALQAQAAEDLGVPLLPDAVV